MKYILLSEKGWHKPLFEELKNEVESHWLMIDNIEEFNIQKLNEFKPDKIFIPHWSYIIPSEIYCRFECIIFHMTDLPYGRGGSPLQNLIEKGHTETMITAIKVQGGIDTGEVYLKNRLLLHGSALEIFIRSASIIKAMIKDIHSASITPTVQEGEPVVFKRRMPEQSNIAALEDINKVYDYIRMLDCQGYPQAYIENEHFRFEFSRVSYTDHKTLQADVRIIQK